MKTRTLVLPALVLLCAVTAFAAETILTWPPDGKEPILRFTIGKLRQVNSYSGQVDYTAETMVENLGKSPMPFASFYVYLLDKNRKRVGEGYLELSNLGVGQQVKVALTAHAMGSVASLELKPQHLPSDEPIKIKMSISSTPPGATIKLDGQDAGSTPQTLPLAPGKHVVEFRKDGYESSRAPVEIAEGGLPGTVSVELIPLTKDTVVLRDGTVVLGDVSSVSATVVSVNVKGKIRSFERMRVARIVFVEPRKPKRPAAKGK